jgi:hypothetical protein
MAPWRVFGERYETADMSNTRVHQPTTFGQDVILIGCRVWFIVYNNPPFTSLSMKVYSNNAGSPKKLLHTSTNTQAKAAVHTLDHAVNEFWFDFASIPLRGGDTYHFVVNATGYTGTESSHLAWMRGFPDPVHRPSPFGYVHAGVAPFTLYFIGSEV